MYLELRHLKTIRAIHETGGLARAAEAMNNMIEEGVKSAAVTEVTAKYRDGERLVQKERCDFLRPTLLHVTDPDDSMANTEFMFPFASVVEIPQERMLHEIGETLVVSLFTGDKAWIREAMVSPDIERLNIGPFPTNRVQWEQPHEGNLFEFLYRRRAIQGDLAAAH